MQKNERERERERERKKKLVGYRKKMFIIDK